MAEPNDRPQDRVPSRAADLPIQVVYPVLGEQRVSPVALATIALRRWRVLLGVPFAFFAVAVVVKLVLGPRYTAQSRFKAQTSETATSRVSGLAAQFGIVLGGMSGGESVEFYAALVKSPSVLKEVVRTQYEFPADPSGEATLSGTIFDLYRIKDPDPDRRMRLAIEALTGQITVGTDLKTGLVTVQTRTRWKSLSEQMNRRLLDLVNDFNLRKLQSQAAAERQFVESRMATARQELEVAENALDKFLEQNRRIDDSPQLRSRAAQLQRRVDLRQQVFITLAQAYEQARIEEVRNTPVITTVDAPEGSAKRRRGLAAAAIMAFAIGLSLAVAMVLGKEYLGRTRTENPEEFAQLEAAASSLRRALSRRRVLSALERGGR